MRRHSFQVGVIDADNPINGSIDATLDATVRLSCGPSNCHGSSSRNYGPANDRSGRASMLACEHPKLRRWLRQWPHRGGRRSRHLRLHHPPQFAQTHPPALLSLSLVAVPTFLRDEVPTFFLQYDFWSNPLDLTICECSAGGIATLNLPKRQP